MKTKLLVFALVIVPLVLFAQFSVGKFQDPEPDFAYSQWRSNFDSGQLYTSESSYVEHYSLAYTPLYYVIWFNLGGAYATGQIISCISTVLVVCLLYLLAGVWIRNQVLRVVPGALFLLSYTTMYWGCSTRSDLLALLFVVGGVLCYFRKGFWVALPLFLLAFFTKQFYVVAVVAILLVELRRSVRQGSTYVGGFLFWLGLAFLACWVGFGSNLFRHVFLFPLQSGGAAVLDFGRFLWSVLVTIGYNLGILLGLVALNYRFRTRSLNFLDLWFCLAFLEVLVCIGKPGSGTSYGLEVLVAGSLLTAVVLSKFMTRRVCAKSSLVIPKT